MAQNIPISFEEVLPEKRCLGSRSCLQPNIDQVNRVLQAAGHIGHVSQAVTKAIEDGHCCFDPGDHFGLHLPEGA